MSTSGNLIIVPAYDEEVALGALLEKTRALYPEADVVVVDDGSKDRTSAIGAAAGAVVLSHPVNLGYGASLQTGIRYALSHSYDTAVFLDGDGQHEPEDLAKLIAPVVSGQCDVAVGSRVLAGGQYRHRPLKWVGVRVFSWLVRAITGIPVTDPTSGARALNRVAMRLYVTEGFPDEFPDANAIIMYHRAGLRVREIPVRMYPSRKKRPMHRGFNILYYVFNVFFSIFIALLQKGPEIRKE